MVQPKLFVLGTKVQQLPWCLDQTSPHSKPGSHKHCMAAPALPYRSVCRGCLDTEPGLPPRRCLDRADPGLGDILDPSWLGLPAGSSSFLLPARMWPFLSQDTGCSVPTLTGQNTGLVCPDSSEQTRQMMLLETGTKGDGRQGLLMTINYLRGQHLDSMH